MKRCAAPLLAVTVAAFLIGCGGNKATTSTTTSNAAPAGTTAPMSEAHREQGALPAGSAAPIPADVNCGAAKPVWVNLNSKAYHLSDDPYYGRTKNGKYMCAADADAQGYHAAGASHKHMHGKHSSSNSSY